MIANLRPKDGLYLTINTTEDCNLRCKYCYETEKRSKNIPLNYAKRFLEILINEDDDPVLTKGSVGDSADAHLKYLYTKGVVLDFIGGDSLMNVKDLDEIIKYFIYLLNTSKTEIAKLWRDTWKLSISSNGTLFSSPEVRAFCEKYKKVLSLSVSIDGCPEIHDLNRVFPDGSGSMKSIREWWPWYRKTFPTESIQTKATSSRDSIPYLFESIKFMHEELGIQYLNHNFIMEDMHLQPGDLELLDKEFEKCVDYVLEHRQDLYWAMIGKETFAQHRRSVGREWTHKGHCGSGAMPALGTDGNIYPCFRFLPHTQNGVVGVMKVGDVFDGLYQKENFINVREGAYKVNCTRDPKCIECDYESACPYCIGGCYAEFGEFKRSTYVCEVIKLQCKWAKIYWNRYNELEGIEERF